jgi:hypothetical protein
VIAAANEVTARGIATTVTFDTNMMGTTVTLSQRLTLDAGPGRITIDGGNDRVLQIAGGVVVTVTGLTIQHGSASDGAGGGGVLTVGRMWPYFDLGRWGSPPARRIAADEIADVQTTLAIGFCPHVLDHADNLQCGPVLLLAHSFRVFDHQTATVLLPTVPKFLFLEVAVPHAVDLLLRCSLPQHAGISS